MDSDTIIPRLREFITANFLLGADDRPIAPDDSFMNGGIIDSTGVLELVSYVEETFDLKVLDDEMTPENLDSLNHLSAFICRKVKN